MFNICIMFNNMFHFKLSKVSDEILYNGYNHSKFSNYFLNNVAIKMLKILMCYLKTKHKIVYEDFNYNYNKSHM